MKTFRPHVTDYSASDRQRDSYITWVEQFARQFPRGRPLEQTQPRLVPRRTATQRLRDLI